MFLDCFGIGMNHRHLFIFSGVPKAWSWAQFGQGTGPIVLDGVHCTGNELSLEECPHAPWGRHNCDHMEDAGVSCNPFTGEDDTNCVRQHCPYDNALNILWGPKVLPLLLLSQFYLSV